MIHSLDSTQINEVLAMLMSPEQVEALKFYSETAVKMRKPVEKKDWNKEFQKLLARADDQMKFRKLYNLAHDFGTNRSPRPLPSQPFLSTPSPSLPAHMLTTGRFYPLSRSVRG